MDNKRQRRNNRRQVRKTLDNYATALNNRVNGLIIPYDPKLTLDLFKELSRTTRTTDIPALACAFFPSQIRVYIAFEDDDYKHKQHDVLIIITSHEAIVHWKGISINVGRGP